MSLGEQRSEELEWAVALGRGCRGGMFPVPALGTGTSLGGASCERRERASGTLQWDGACFRGEGTPTGWGPPLVHVWGPAGESSKIDFSTQEQARGEQHRVPGISRGSLSNKWAMALWGLGMVAGDGWGGVR